MSKIFKQQTARNTIGIHSANAPATIVHHSQKPSTFEVDGKNYNASCAGCLNPVCMRFSPNELLLPGNLLSEFPADVDDSVCPTNAIVWERGHDTPTIISDLCINCGICARRCPFGAIYSDGYTGIIHINEEDVLFVVVNSENARNHENQVRDFKNAKHTGQYLLPHADFIENIYAKLHSLQTGAQFPNLAVRNLLLTLGNKCIIRRRGDVYFRIDAAVINGNLIGIAEIEFKKDSLESPRAILDDIAVLSSRYGVDKDKIKPLIISLEFPNTRTEYWRVIKDIKDVLGIEIQSISFGAICLLAWSFRCVSIDEFNFYADIDSPSIKNGIEQLCAFDVIQIPKNRAILEPTK